MKNAIPPRLRAPVLLLAAGAAVLIAGGATNGWASAAYSSPVLLVLAAGFYALGGRDSDIGAAIRRQLDERQALQRLRVQALVGRVLAIAVTAAYLAAAMTKATLWPYAVLLGTMAASILAGWLIYGDRSPRGEGKDARQSGPA